MHLHLNPTKEQIEEVLNTPGVKKALTGYDNAQYEYVPEWNYLSIREGNEIIGSEYTNRFRESEIIGFLATSVFSPVACELHFALKPQYWGTGLSDQVTREFEEIMQRQEVITHVIALIPSVCKHVLHLLQRLHFKQDTILKDFTKYGGDVVDLVILSRPVRLS